jgi:hypothetical protein
MGQFDFMRVFGTISVFLSVSASASVFLWERLGQMGGKQKHKYIVRECDSEMEVWRKRDRYR